MTVQLESQRTFRCVEFAFGWVGADDGLHEDFTAVAPTGIQ